MSTGKTDGLFIVTGASRGVGRATALSLCRDHGRSVLAIARDGAAMEALIKEPPGTGTIEMLCGDLTDPVFIKKVNSHVGDRRVMGLVNNAGLLVKRSMGEWMADDLTRLFTTNVFAPLMLIQSLAGRLGGSPPGHVVNIGSMGGFHGSVKFPGLAAYSASKAALANLSECLAEEYKVAGIRVNCLALGSVDTDMLREAFPGYRAPTSEAEMGAFVARFAIEGHGQFNGKVLPVAVSTP